ncbi:Bifunctional polynucleotide phosphatase/kinase [Orchesella cincta]|uniref:Bifunctional polynucleotide phosphatase/kinase n=1 Tax=Orchesella cincta TaxID=48709 RepID=A0A1D2N387_ORCCI|nr:Bifunctional polynucleotide phosphatase/kinase [Orchesella cincta]
MTCLLRPQDPKFPEIPLPDGEVVTVGRGPLSKIKDSRCSRTQLEFRANYKTRKVSVKQVGPNESALNGTPIGIGIEEVGKENDSVDILFGEHRYKIVFEGLPPLESIPVKPAKIPKMFSSKDQFKKDGILPKVGEWKSKGDQLHIYTYGDIIRRAKANIAGFDMDGTIITTKSGKVFPKDDKDWRFLYNSTVQKLQTFFEDNDNFKFVIVTNQAGMANGKTSLEGMKKKVEAIVSQLGIPVVVYIIPGRNEYRKPVTGIWNLFVEEYNESVEPNPQESFFCGDAAGRKKDHSLSDRLFALNLGIGFKTPEEFFMGQKPQEFTMPLFQPRKLLDNPPSNDHIQYPDSQEMIIMVGFPGSGKSSFVKSQILTRSYVHVNRDTLKTAAKCLSVADEALKSGKSVVVDNTNPERKDRAEYIKLASKSKVPVRCFKMNITHNQALHNNRFRELSRENPGQGSVPAVAFNTFKSRLQEPTKDEGFTDVLLVNFVPTFSDDKKRELYGKYLLEK